MLSYIVIRKVFKGHLWQRPLFFCSCSSSLLPFFSHTAFKQVPPQRQKRKKLTFFHSWDVIFDYYNSSLTQNCCGQVAGQRLTHICKCMHKHLERITKKKKKKSWDIKINGTVATSCSLQKRVICTHTVNLPHTHTDTHTQQTCVQKRSMTPFSTWDSDTFFSHTSKFLIWESLSSERESHCVSCEERQVSLLLIKKQEVAKPAYVT